MTQRASEPLRAARSCLLQLRRHQAPSGASGGRAPISAGRCHPTRGGPSSNVTVPRSSTGRFRMTTRPSMSAAVIPPPGTPQVPAGPSARRPHKRQGIHRGRDPSSTNSTAGGWLDRMPPPASAFRETDIERLAGAPLESTTLRRRRYVGRCCSRTSTPCRRRQPRARSPLPRTRRSWTDSKSG